MGFEPKDLSDAERKTLGALRSLHPGGSGDLKFDIGYLLLIAALLWGFAIWLLADIPDIRVNPHKNHLEFAVLCGVIGLLFASYGAYEMRKRWWCLVLYDRGFVIAARTRRVVLWDEVEQFFNKKEQFGIIPGHSELRFVFLDGRTLKIQSLFKDFKVFHEAVATNIAEAVLRKAVGRIDKGEVVSFGNLKVTREGLEREEISFFGLSADRIGWAQVDRILVASRKVGLNIVDSVVIYKKDWQAKASKTEWYLYPIPSFPNVTAFLQLAERFVHDQVD